MTTPIPQVHPFEPKVKIGQLCWCGQPRLSAAHPHLYRGWRGNYTGHSAPPKEVCVDCQAALSHPSHQPLGRGAAKCSCYGMHSQDDCPIHGYLPEKPSSHHPVERGAAPKGSIEELLDLMHDAQTALAVQCNDQCEEVAMRIKVYLAGITPESVAAVRSEPPSRSKHRRVAREISKKSWDDEAQAAAEIADLLSIEYGETSRKESMFICGKWKHLEDGCVARCDQPDKHPGRHVDSVIAIGWDVQPTAPEPPDSHRDGIEMDASYDPMAVPEPPCSRCVGHGEEANCICECHGPFQKAFYDVFQELEHLPASEQQTKCVTMLTQLRDNILFALKIAAKAGLDRIQKKLAVPEGAPPKSAPKRPDPPPYRGEWMSVCSRHREYRPDCRICNAGHWISSEEREFSHWLWEYDKDIWRKWANRTDASGNRIDTRLEEIFPGLKAKAAPAESGQERARAGVQADPVADWLKERGEWMPYSRRVLMQKYAAAENAVLESQVKDLRERISEIRAVVASEDPGDLDDVLEKILAILSRPSEKCGKRTLIPGQSGLYPCQLSPGHKEDCDPKEGE